MFHDIMTNGNYKMRFKDSNMATSMHEDTGFCSGDDYMEHELHSPTDSSEDSVEVKVSTITFNHKKRKILEETRVCKETTFSGPLKKRMCLKVKAEANDVNTMLTTGKTPFRPWSPSKPMQAIVPNFVVPQAIKLETPCVQVTPEVSNGAFSSYFCPSPSPIAQQQTEPVSLVIKREKDELSCTEKPTISDTRVPIHPQITRLTPAETERMILKSHEQFPGLQACGPSSQPASYSSSQNHHDNDNDTLSRHESKREQRNYKNMTRERRIEANARERTRVHTISAAFDTLRRSVPAYSHNQKLSKLSVLRIACSYIMTLSSLVQDDDETPSSDPPTSECVEQVSRTIQREGKLRKKKDDND